MIQWQSAEWLTAERLKIYPRLIFVLYVIGIISWVMLATDNIDLKGRYLGADFISFYAAGKLALQGHGALVYDVATHYQMELDIIGVQGFEMPFLSFSYPPTLLILLAPLSTLPYFYAFLVFQLSSLIFFILMIKKLINCNEGIMLCLAFPAVFLTFCYGQNALLSTGLMAGALFYIDRKPLLSGLLIGLLTFKPHLGVLIPLVLMLTGRWRVFLAASLTFVSLVLISSLAFGIEIWQGFWGGKELVKRILHDELVPYSLMQSMFTGVRSMGTGIVIAYALQALIASVSAVCVLWIWSCQVDMRLKIAAFAIGTLMISPYLLNYDLMILSISIACLASYSLEFGFRHGLINLLCLSWISPIIVRTLNSTIPFPWTPLLLSVILYQILMITRRVNFNSNKLNTIEVLK
ncbi:glycosyltransferase family 87 protein [Thalassotalea fonticola]|uniref:Glycosyltransferase family 87 protein n=1 Tax=Thalassotalea fonticola TaxID=3065649 RepID=A0ABZ0GUD6_9GAMM|nr:glycosyltransferase family 87 protein [Colwelliaceae bacterium S1-1]